VHIFATMMKSMQVAGFVTAASASTIGLTWSDCGDSSTHGKVTDLQPTSFSPGDDVTIEGTGTLDTTITGGSFEIKMNADGLIHEDWKGDVCEAKTFSLPLGLGKVSWGGMSCPVAAGTLSVPLGVKLAASIPASLASGTIAATATATNGDNLVCVNAQMAKQAERQVEVSSTIGLTWSDCGDSSTHGKVTDLQPTSFSPGDDVTIEGTGTLDTTITGGSFEIKMNAAGLIHEDWKGDVCEAKTFSLPLGLGKVSWGGMSCPVAAGTLSVPLGVQLSASIPASLASGTIAATATATNGDSLVCVNAQMAKQSILV